MKMTQCVTGPKKGGKWPPPLVLMVRYSSLAITRIG